MKKISRRNMMQLSGLTAAGSLVGLTAYSAPPAKEGTRDKKLKMILQLRIPMILKVVAFNWPKSSISDI
jgi:hypothetical protein